MSLVFLLHMAVIFFHIWQASKKHHRNISVCKKLIQTRVDKFGPRVGLKGLYWDRASTFNAFHCVCYRLFFLCSDHKIFSPSTPDIRNCQSVDKLSCYTIITMGHSVCLEQSWTLFLNVVIVNRHSSFVPPPGFFSCV